MRFQAACSLGAAGVIQDYFMAVETEYATPAATQLAWDIRDGLSEPLAAVARQREAIHGDQEPLDWLLLGFYLGYVFSMEEPRPRREEVAILEGLHDWT